MQESLFLKEFEFDDALINRNCYQEEILAGLSTLKVRDGSMDINCETEPHDNLENDRRHLLDAAFNATNTAFGTYGTDTVLYIGIIEICNLLYSAWAKHSKTE